MVLPDPRRFRLAALVVVYLILLAASHGYRRLGREGVPTRTLGDRSLRIIESVGGDSLSIAYADDGEPGDPRPAILALHGSPGSSSDFGEILRHRSSEYRWIVVDLPGFGASTRRLTDYSFASHAAHMESFLKARGVDRVHLLAFSMGGGAALQLYRRDPRRVASLILLGSIGVQELELLGDYEVNHALHGLQLVGLWLLYEGVPHFGLLEGSMLDLSYARNFFDSDQRPLREILRGVQCPVLILHGRDDPLVPLAAAKEHRRIVPHSRLREFEGGHFLPWQRAGEIASETEDWVRGVQAGTEPSRAAAGAERLERARLPFESLEQPRAHGIGRALLILLLVVGTFVAEDLSCLSAGILIAQGRLDWSAGLMACAGGIFFGDLLLYLAGRWLGASLVERRPLRWLVSPRKLLHAEHWFARRGLAVIFLTRFLPGTRLPAYVAAGVLRTPFWRFTGYFLLAVLLWTPLIVGAAALIGERSLGRLRQVQHAGVLALLSLAVLFFLLLRIALPLLSWKGRRLWLGRWRRFRRWEFWPAWLVYLLLLPDLVRLSLRSGGFHVATAVNPAMETGGLVGESKSEILGALGAGAAAFVLLPAEETAERRAERVRAAGLGYPLVIKPDVGERGRGVEICAGEDQLRARLARDEAALIAQEYVNGLEFGVFYARHPEEPGGRILSLARKLLPELRGDGARSVEELVLLDERAVCMAPVYLDRLEHRLDEIPADGERLRLTELGTHCRGAVFLDGSDLATPELLAALDATVAACGGFYFGRFDLKAPSEEDLRAGRNLRILELNGLSSEAAHIYDPKFSLGEGLRALREQWRLAFEIAAELRRRGVEPTGPLALAARVLRHLFRTST